MSLLGGVMSSVPNRHRPTPFTGARRNEVPTYLCGDFSCDSGWLWLRHTAAEDWDNRHLPSPSVAADALMCSVCVISARKKPNRSIL